MNIKSAHLLTALAGRIVRQVGRNFRPNISADFAEIFGRIFGFGRTLQQILEQWKKLSETTYSNGT